MTISEPALFTFRLAGPPTVERLSDRAVDRLRTLIITLELEPGSLIDESSLSQRLDCGRTPLREAIQRLAEETLLVILPHRSVAVAPITLTDLQQIYEARTTLECAAVRFAAQRITPAQRGVAGGEGSPAGNSLRERRSGGLLPPCHVPF